MLAGSVYIATHVEKGSPYSTGRASNADGAQWNVAVIVACWSGPRPSACPSRDCIGPWVGNWGSGQPSRLTIRGCPARRGMVTSERVVAASRPNCDRKDQGNPGELREIHGRIAFRLPPQTSLTACHTCNPGSSERANT